MQLDPRKIARRALDRVLAERGLAGPPTALQGVQVAIRPADGADRPASKQPTPVDLGLITAESLVELEAGQELQVPQGALVTDLARDVARQRGIELVPAPGGSPTPGPIAPEAGRSGREQRGPLRIAIGADHGGYPLKCDLIDWIRDLGHLPIDLGTHGTQAVDYPDFALAVAEAVRDDRCHLGVCIDGAGLGSTMAANKVPGVRAANCHDVASASNAREHNYANVLCLGGPRLAPSLALEILRTFLTTPWGAERHGRRVEKITRIEERYARQPLSRP